MADYRAASITQSQFPKLDALPITRQAEITKAYSPLILSKTVEMLKDATENFTKDDELARKVDAELHTLLTNKGFYKSDSAAAPKAASSELEGVLSRITALKFLMKKADGDKLKNLESRMAALNFLKKKYSK